MFNIGQIERELAVYQVYTSLGIDINPRWQQIGFKQEYFQLKTNIMNTITELKTFKDSYPHQLIMDGENLTIVATVEHSIGDGFTFGWNHKKGTINMVVWRVKEIVETRKPRGKHADEKAMFYHFKVAQSVENTSQIEIIQPN